MPKNQAKSLNSKILSLVKKKLVAKPNLLLPDNIIPNYHFVPVGIETYGPYGPQGIKLVKQIGKKKSGSYR